MAEFKLKFDGGLFGRLKREAAAKPTPSRNKLKRSGVRKRLVSGRIIGLKLGRGR